MGERTALAAVLQREAAMCRDLLGMEPEAKWPLLTLVRLLELQRGLLLAGGGSGSAADTAGAAETGDGAGYVAFEIPELYIRLDEVDPLRQGYYADARAGRAEVVAVPRSATSA